MKNKLSLAGKNIAVLLQRHGYDTQLNEENDLTIYKAKAKSKEKTSITQHLLFLLLTLLIAGYFLLMGRIIGLSVFFLYGLFLLITRNKIETNKIEGSNDLIKISRDNIIIEKKDTQITITVEEINQIETSVFKQDNPCQGRIILKRNKLDEVMLLDLTSDSKKYLADDLDKIVDFLYLKLYGEEN